MAGQFFSVINNLNSYNSQKNLGVANAGMNSSLGRISSGMRINDAGDDAAGLAIGNGLKADFTALTQAVQNANEGAGIIQVADSALSQMGDMMARAAQLASQAASGTVGPQERETINMEYRQIMAEVDRLVDATNYKGEQLFSPTAPVTKDIAVGDTQLQSSIALSIGGTQGVGTTALGLEETSLATPKEAQEALFLIREASKDIAEMRGALGAQENRLTNAVGVIQVQSQNILAAESSIMDTNMAEEVSMFTRTKILTEAGMASLAQANANSQMVLQLFK
ncbi:MAG: flagellin [Candidatus Omnitrophota bacterium]